MLHSVVKNLKYFGILLSLASVTVSANKYSRFKPIDKQRIFADKEDIRKYIKATESNVWKGETAGEWAASWFGVNSKAFKAMPVEFFKDHQGVQQSIEQLFTEQAIEYMNQGKDEFVGRYLSSPTANFKINAIAGFLHDRMVDHLDISDDSKNRLKKDPLLIAKLVTKRDKKTHQYMHMHLKNQYMNLTCQNITIQYYIEKEFGKEAS